MGEGQLPECKFLGSSHPPVPNVFSNCVECGVLEEVTSGKAEKSQATMTR